LIGFWNLQNKKNIIFYVKNEIDNVDKKEIMRQANIVIGELDYLKFSNHK
jgi:hypothetical protein